RWISSGLLQPAPKSATPASAAAQTASRGNREADGKYVCTMRKRFPTERRWTRLVYRYIGSVKRQGRGTEPRRRRSCGGIQSSDTFGGRLLVSQERAACAREMWGEFAAGVSGWSLEGCDKRSAVAPGPREAWCDCAALVTPCGIGFRRINKRKRRLTVIAEPGSGCQVGSGSMRLPAQRSTSSVRLRDFFPPRPLPPRPRRAV